MDNFTIAVLIGFVVVLAILGLMVALDKKRPEAGSRTPAPTPVKPTGRRPA